MDCSDSRVLAVKTFAGIPDNAKDVEPLSFGSPAPTFTVRTTEGVLRTFSTGTYQKPTVILFYRGGWCPYCNRQLSDLRLVEPKLRANGFEIVFLSTDRPELLYSSLQAADIH
jgi:peroxiredoxin